MILCELVEAKLLMHSVKRAPYRNQIHNMIERHLTEWPLYCFHMAVWTKQLGLLTADQPSVLLLTSKG